MAASSQPGSAAPAAPPAAAPATRLEVRLGPGDGRPAGRTGFEDLDAALDGAPLSRVETLTLALRGRAPGPAALEDVARLAERLPALRALTACALGAVDRDGIPALLALRERCGRRGASFAVRFALDAGADACAAMSGRPTSLAGVLEASRLLRGQGCPVRWLVPALPALVCRLEPIFSLAEDEGVECALVPAWAVSATFGLADEALSPDQELFLWDFVSYRLLEPAAAPLPPESAAFYRAVRDSLGAAAARPPAGVRAAAVLELADGPAGPRLAWREEARPSFGPPAGRDAPRRGGRLARTAAQAADVAGVLAEGQRALGQWLAAQAVDPLRRGGGAAAERRLPRVLVIGAYGGEHIGDTAILGGVLLRIHRRYGTTRAILMSQRPAHTRHLVPMLDTPVAVEVEAYEQSRVRALLPQVDAVVFAGGPLMDLPKQLVKHLYAVSRARRAGKPFVAEGIGAGPFIRWPSEWTARRLVKMAERIAVRTSDDAQARLVRDLDPEIGRDPAFDYLETRPAELTRLPAADRRWVESLAKEAEGRVTVGLNIRPIRPDYTVGISGRRRADYTRRTEARFEQRLADGLRRFHEAVSPPPCFVFFPMNAIQFGLSDLRSAYRIQRLLRGEVDFRVWQADASLDGVLALLRRLDLVVTMRFHATIFALSQGRPVIGIDYRIGRKDKVAALLDDLGQGENCERIDRLTAEWLFARLCALSGAGPSGEEPRP